MTDYCTRPTHHTKRRGRAIRCGWCGQPIDRGEVYAKWLFYTDGTRNTVYAHTECHDAWQLHAKIEGGIACAHGDRERPQTAKERE